jgi:hypothetical protein
VPEEPLVWDGCGLLNLAATTRAEEVLRSLGRESSVVAEVLEREALYLRPLPEEDASGTVVPTDVSRLVEMRALAVVTLTPAEIELFVRLAEQVDDGEARTIAVAWSRGLRLVTDDRAALRVWRELGARAPGLTTPEWVRLWSEACGSAPEVIGGVLRRIEVCARYRPRHTHPLYEWWEANVSRP